MVVLYFIYYCNFVITLFVSCIKVEKKKVLGFELIYIDENNRFFYNNLFIEMKDLQNYVIGKDEIILNFIDYMIVVEKDENLYDYLNRFVKNKKPIYIKKARLSIIVLTIPFVLFSLSLGNLLLGRIYSYFKSCKK